MLSVSAIRTAEPPSRRYTLADGHGLSLQVLPNGAKYWRFRYRFDHRAKMLSLGTYPDTSLDIARDLLAGHIDPSAHRRSARVARRITFEAVARPWLARREQLLHTEAIAPRTFNKQAGILSKYLFAEIGRRPIGSLAPQELLIALKKLESKGLYNTAHRARQICAKVFQFAVVRGYATSNAADAVRGLLEPLRHRQHAAILNPARLGTLLRAIDNSPRTFVWYALQLIPLRRLLS